MPIPIGEFSIETSGFSNEQIGAYLLLQLAAWTRDGKLPNDDTQLGRMARATPDEWQDIKSVLKPLFKVTKGSWVHQGLLERKQYAVTRSKARSEAGKKGGRPRKGDVVESNSFANAKQELGIREEREEESTEKEKEKRREEEQAPASSASADLSSFSPWVEKAKASGAYPGLEIDAVLKKFIHHCDVEGGKPTEKWFTNWLKSERPATQTGNGATIPKRSAWHIAEDIKAISNAISNHPANPESIRSSGSNTAEQRAELRQLKNRLSELEKEKLEGAMAGAKVPTPEQKAEPVKTDKSNFEKMRREWG
jgi:uncharacterized protein YdaU (DUF1376 family)